MGHVVDKVCFHLGKFFLSERENYCVKKYQQQYECHHQRRYDESYGREDIRMLGGKLNFKIIICVGIRE